MTTIQSKRICFLLTAVVLTICAGLALRRYGYDLGLPFLIVKYGGSILWGVMVYFIVAAASIKFSSRSILAFSLLIAVSVELFRLYHNPSLDAFRTTAIGALLIGRVFSVWNIAAYASGILAAHLAMVLHEHDLSAEKDKPNERKQRL